MSHGCQLLSKNMIKSIITTALRNIFRHKAFSLINLIGLSVSMSLGLLIIMVIREQYTFDKFHNDADRIYRINTLALRKDGGSEPYASVPLPIGTVIKDNYSFANQVVRICDRLRADAILPNVNVPVRGMFVDPTFLEMFNFPLEKGNSDLSDPKDLILTHEAAEKIFGKQEAVGQTLLLSGYGEFKVSGVLREINKKTHLEFEVLASTMAMSLLKKDSNLSQSFDDWTDYYSGYVYFKLNEGKDKSEVEQALMKIAKERYANIKLETRDRGYQFYLQPLNEITPGPLLSNQLGKGMPQLLVIFLSALVSIVMLVACFNYTSLTIAKSISRSREIGMRKIVGAKRVQIFVQFIGEAVVFSALSLLVSYILLQLLKPAFMQLNIAREFSTTLTESYSLHVIFFLFALTIGVIAGLLPAAYLSAFRPLQVLKDSGRLKIYSRLTFRKVLIVGQFTLSFVFIILVLAIHNQVNYMLNADYGINDKNILNVRLQGMEFQKFANEVRKLNGVDQVGGVSHQLGTWSDHSSNYKRHNDEESFVMRDFLVDDNYIENIEIDFVAGKNFDPATEGENERHVILNEKAIPLFKLTDSSSAIGQTIFLNDSVELTVIGVVKDFHFRPLSYEIGPLALRYNPRELTFLSAKFFPGRKEQITAAIESIWKKLDPNHIIEMKTMHQEIEDAYTQAGFTDLIKIVGYGCFLIICLACFGMLGMVMYSMQQSLKEISVRKVMGASTPMIAIRLSKSFLSLIVIAVLIGILVGYFLEKAFAQQFAYKAPISIFLYGVGVLFIVIISLTTIISQTWTAASSNPTKFLRNES
jgi:putative ABC transport system permease protein